jgi:hypothetical protein
MLSVPQSSAADQTHPNGVVRTHPPHGDPARVSANQRDPGGTERRCHEIRVRGPIGPTIMQAFPCLTATQTGHDTLLTGSLPDQSALYGVIHQLEALGLQLLEIRRLPTGGPERAQ